MEGGECRGGVTYTRSSPRWNSLHPWRVVATLCLHNPTTCLTQFLCKISWTMAPLSNVVLLLSALKSIAFSPILPSATHLLGTQLAAMAPLDQELELWASSEGYGKIDKAIPAGSSGWASFRKVTVTNPPESNGKPVSFFVKSSSRSAEEMFLGEALGLKAMYECSQGEDSLRIPKVYHYGDFAEGKGSLIVMEYLNLAGRSDDRALGKAMAKMHLAPPTEQAGNSNKSFGFPVDNTIGGTPQPNPWTKPNSGTKEWIEFFRDHRIGHQLNLAGDSYCSNLWENDISPRLHLLFEDLRGDKEIKPSLLHGDLWSGNIGSADGKPSIFDPAVYWGHHEAEWGVSFVLS
jgi:protein-ribulosamine 3-kinase